MLIIIITTIIIIVIIIIIIIAFSGIFNSIPRNLLEHSPDFS